MTFVPAAFLNGVGTLENIKRGTLGEVTGHVVYINEKHRYCRVEFDLPGCKGYECFKY